MNLRSVNQNLLPVLNALLRERNVSRAAASLGLTQPAASKALDQLRGVLNDPLLVRVGREMQLTRRAEALVQPVSRICRDLEGLWQAAEFDPGTASREFVVAGSDYTAALLVPRLAGRLAEQAPGVSLRFMDCIADTLLDERVDVDLAIAPTAAISNRLAAAAEVMPMFVDEFVTVVGPDHPLADKARLEPEDIANARRIGFGRDTPRLRGGLVDEQPFGKAAGPTLALVQQFTLLPLLALYSDALAIVPRRLAEMMSARVALRILEGGVPPGRVDMALIWTSRHAEDADHRWFRQLILDEMTDDRFR